MPIKQINHKSVASKFRGRFYAYKQNALINTKSSRNAIEQTVSRTIALQWDSLEVKNASFLGIEQEVAVIPLRYKNKDMVINGYRKLIIFKDQAGNEQIKVLEVTASPEYLQNNNQLIEKHNLTGTLTIHDLYGGFEGGVILESGNIINPISHYTNIAPTSQRSGNPRDCGYWKFIPHNCYAHIGCGDEHETGGHWIFVFCSTDIRDFSYANGTYFDWMIWLDNQYANDYAQNNPPYWDNSYNDPNHNNNGYEIVNLDEPQEPSEIDEGAPKPNAFNIRGKIAHIQTFIALLNKATGNTYAYDADTKTLTRTSTTLNNVTDSSKSAYLSQLVEEIITGQRIFFECKIVNNDSDVLFDNFPDGRIDIADLQKAPDDAFLAGLLVHLIEERLAVPNGGYKEESKKKDYEVYEYAHQIALQKEAEVVSAMLGLSGVSKREYKETIANVVGNTFDVGGATTTVKIQYIYGSVIYEFENVHKAITTVVVNPISEKQETKFKTQNKGVITGSIIKK